MTNSNDLSERPHAARTCRAGAFAVLLTAILASCSSPKPPEPQPEVPPPPVALPIEKESAKITVIPDPSLRSEATAERASNVRVHVFTTDRPAEFENLSVDGYWKNYAAGMLAMPIEWGVAGSSSESPLTFKIPRKTGHTHAVVVSEIWQKNSPLHILDAVIELEIDKTAPLVDEDGTPKPPTVIPIKGTVTDQRWVPSTE